MAETPKYSIAKKQNEIEIRHYPAYIQAEVVIDEKLIPARSLAAIRFSGFFRQDTIHKNKQRLSQWLQKQGFETEGDFIVAGYNPPWVPGFLARNEVLIPIKIEPQEQI